MPMAQMFNFNHCFILGYTSKF